MPDESPPEVVHSSSSSSSSRSQVQKAKSKIVIIGFRKIWEKIICAAALVPRTRGGGLLLAGLVLLV